MESSKGKVKIGCMVCGSLERPHKDGKVHWELQIRQIEWHEGARLDLKEPIILQLWNRPIFIPGDEVTIEIVRVRHHD